MVRSTSLLAWVALLLAITALYGSAPAYVLGGAGDGLVAYYPFDEGGGSIALDWSGNFNTASWTGSAPHYVPGIIGSAGYFNGTNASVRLSKNIPFGSGSFAIAAWFKTNADTTGSSQEIWNSGYNGGNPDIEITTHNNHVNFNLRDSSGTSSPTYSSLNTINDNKWHLVVAVRNGNVFTLYIDGIYQSSATQALNTVDITSVTPTLGNGAAAINNRWFNGSLDDPRAYSRAPSPNEVAALYRWTGPQVSRKVRTLYPQIYGMAIQ